MSKKTVPLHVMRMFAITSIIGTAIRVSQSSDIKLITLFNQCNRALRVFSYKVGVKQYFTLAKEIDSIWEEVDGISDTLLSVELLSLMVEMLGRTVPPSHYKTFLGVTPYISPFSKTLDSDLINGVQKLVNLIEERVNSAYSTKPYKPLTPLGGVEKAKKAKKVKRVKVVKVVKEKKKSIPKKVKKIKKLENELVEVRDRWEKSTLFKTQLGLKMENLEKEIEGLKD